MSVSDFLVYGVHDTMLVSHLFSQQVSFLVSQMAECGVKGEVTQRCLGVKEQQNGEMTGKNRDPS